MDGFFSASEARSIKPTPSLLPRCEACKMYVGCKSPKMKPTGKGRRRILICGDYPGEHEDEKGYQYAGGAGGYLEAELRRFGVDMREDCILTNALICYSASDDPPSKHKTAIEDCRPNLLRTIKENNPEVILLLGTSSVKSLIGYLWKSDTGAHGRWVGNTIPSQKLNAWVCPTYNPAHLTRRKDEVLDLHFRWHIQQAVSLPGRPYPKGVPDYDSRVEVIMNSEDAARRVRNYNSGIVAVDYETNCAKPDADTSQISCCSVCWEGRETIAFPWQGAVRDAIRDMLENPNVGKIASNMDFEDRWSRAKLGIEVRGWVWDTMLAAHAIDPRSVSEKDPSGISGLKFQAFVRLGCPDYNSHIEPLLDTGGKGGYAINQIHEISPYQLMKYCGKDSLIEYELAQLQMKDLGVSYG